MNTNPESGAEALQVPRLGRIEVAIELTEGTADDRFERARVIAVNVAVIESARLSATRMNDFVTGDEVRGGGINRRARREQRSGFVFFVSFC